MSSCGTANSQESKSFSREGVLAAHHGIHHSHAYSVSPYSMPDPGSPSNSVGGLEASGTYLRHLGIGIRLLQRSKRLWVLILGQLLTHCVTTGKSLASLSLSFPICIMRVELRSLPSRLWIYIPKIMDGKE